jgi:hypothetical protein
MRWTWIAVTIVAYFTTASAQNAPQALPLLRRQYVEGQQWAYRMKGTNNGKTYEVRITGLVKRGEDGRWRDEYAFSDLIADGTPRSLNASNQALRAAVTLDGGKCAFRPS